MREKLNGYVSVRGSKRMWYMTALFGIGWIVCTVLNNLTE